jgi:uncharacterized membrane protein YccC
MNIFLAFGCCMAALAGITLLFPRSRLNAMWKLNPIAHAQMAPLGIWVAIPMLFFSGIMLGSALGWYQRRRWGWLLAVLIISTQLFGDVANFIAGHWLEGSAGVIIAGSLLFWLLSSSVKMAFSATAEPHKESAYLVAAKSRPQTHKGRKR